MMVLQRDVLVECNALELKGAYLGQTAPKVVQKCTEALGGVLFLDEAYALGGTDEFSQVQYTTHSFNALTSSRRKPCAPY
jgi:hypothetical protein